MKTFYSNLFVHVKELQKVAVATLTLLIILFSAINSYSQVLDTTFGTNGITSIPNTTEMYFFDFDGYGNIIAAGITIKGIGEYDLTITKTDENGNLITSFGNNGIVKVTKYSDSYPLCLKITDNNKILILASYKQPYKTVLIQFNEDGTCDTNFAPSGEIFTNIGILNFANLENEFILIGKSDFQTLTSSISKYNYNGILDSSFGIGGIIPLTIGNWFDPYCAKLLRDSSIIIAGCAMYIDTSNINNIKINRELAMCKLTPNGDIDSTFATNGIWHLDICQDFDLDYEYFRHIIEEDNGDLVLSGKGFNFKLFFCKFLSTGVIDTNFDNNGFYSSNIFPNQMYPSVPFLKNGNKYITGNHNTIISINNNGTTDSTFGNNGYFSLANSLVLSDMKLQGKNKIVLGSTLNNNFALARLIIDTTLAPSHTIQGKVTFNGKGLAGVTLSCPNCLTQTEISDQNGKYEFEVAVGASVTITPTLISYTFLPTDTIINNITQNIYNVNFVATDTTTPPLPQTYSVSGNITYNGNGLANVIIDTTTSLITAKSVLITDVAGYYEINDIPENRSLTITPTLEGYKFAPPSYTFTATNNETIDFIAEEELGIDSYELGIGNYELGIYPNPVKDNLNFTEETQVEITDIQGRILLKTTKSVKTFDVSSLNAGAYFLKTNNKIEKFVKE